MFKSAGSEKFDLKFNSSRKQCFEEYEEQIAILQEKLMETHNKLIEQLDVCRQQQLTIIQLTKKILLLEKCEKHSDNQSIMSYSMNSNNADISNQSCRSFEKQLDKINKDMINFTLNHSCHQSNYNSPTFIENNRNELLKADLQMMRLKLVQQINQKSRLTKQLNFLKLQSTQKINEYKNQIKELEHDHKVLMKQYEYLKQSAKRQDINYNSSSQINILTKKCQQYEVRYKEQNYKIVELKAYVNNQKDKVQQLQNELEKYNNCIKSTSTAQGSKDQRQQFCGTIRTVRNPGTLWEKDLNKLKAYGQQVKKQKQNVHYMPKQKFKKSKTNKQNYESTKQLIKKLQQAQMVIRQKKKVILA